MTAEWVAVRTMAEWEAGAKALALLEGVARVGLLETLRTGATEPGLAELTGMEPTRVADICAALYAHGDWSRQQVGGRYRTISNRC